MVNWYKIKDQTSRRLKVKMADMSEYRFYADNPKGTPVGDKHEKEMLANPNYTFEKQDSQWHKDRKRSIEGGMIEAATEKLPEEIKERVKEAIKSSKKKKGKGDV